MRKIIILIIAIPVFAKSQSISPSVINSAGQYFKGTTVSLTYSMGEFSCQTFASSGYSIQSGFLHPTKNTLMARSAANTLLSIKPTSLSFSITPNPAISNALLSIANASGAVSITVTDLNGKPLYQTTTNTAKLNIDVSRFAAGTYMVIVSDEKETRSLKLVKE